MTTEALKSTVVTNLDATPIVVATAGEGASARLRTIDGSATATTGKTAGSTYQLCRVPSNAKLKHAYVKLDGSVTTFTCDAGFYYSTSTTDGTKSANQGTKVNSTTGSQLLGAAVDLHSQTTFTDLCNSLTAANLDKPLWQACGLTTDPGGYFDFVLTNTATNSGAPVAYAELQYAE